MEKIFLPSAFIAWRAGIIFLSVAAVLGLSHLFDASTSDRKLIVAMACIGSVQIAYCYFIVWIFDDIKSWDDAIFSIDGSLP